MDKKLDEYVDLHGDRVEFYKRDIDGREQIYAMINIRNKLMQKIPFATSLKKKFSQHDEDFIVKAISAHKAIIEERDKDKVLLRWFKGNNLTLRLLQYDVDAIDTGLMPVLESIGKAIKAVVAEVDDLSGETDPDLDYLDGLFTEKAELIDNLLGAAFVICQVYVKAFTSNIGFLHKRADIGNVTLNTTDGKEWSVRGYGFYKTDSRSYSNIEIIHAFANYYKHRDEGELGKFTSDPIASIGAIQNSTGNLRKASEYLGNRDYYSVQIFSELISKWGKYVLDAYKAELMKKGLI